LYKSVGPFIHYYEGIQNRLYGDYEAAINNLTLAQTLDPENDAIFYELAISYNMVGETQKSISNLEKAVELSPNNKHYRNLLGILYINQKQFDKALSNQQDLVSIDSVNINYKFQLALLHSEQKNFDEAIALLNTLEDQVGYNVRLAETRLRILIERADFNKALDEVNSIIALDNQNPLFLLYKSEIYFKMGEDSVAFKVINDAIDLDPENPQPQIELYQRFLEIGNYSKALQTLEKLHQNENISAEEKVRLFYPLLFEQTIYTLHSETVDRIIDSLLINHPDEIFVHELSYEHYIRRRKFDMARQELQILTLLDEENPDRWEKLISFDYSIGKKELVIYNSIKASKLYPAQSIFYIFQALVLDELQDTENAIFVLNQGISKVINSSETTEMLGTLGDMYYKIGKYDQAFATYDEALSNEPNNARVLNNYSYYLSVLNKKLDKALEMSTQAVEVEPNNSTYIDTKGWVLFQMGRFDEALEVLRNAIAKSGSTNAVINEHYGDALYKTGNKENAYIYWKKAKDIGGGSDRLDEKLRTRKYVP
jgi:tetratricopeptide (TPR) repeat protein